LHLMQTSMTTYVIKASPRKISYRNNFLPPFQYALTKTLKC